MQRKDDHVPLARERFQLVGGLANLAQARQEREYVAVALVHHVANRVRDRE